MSLEYIKLKYSDILSDEQKNFSNSNNQTKKRIIEQAQTRLEKDKKPINKKPLLTTTVKPQEKAVELVIEDAKPSRPPFIVKPIKEKEKIFDFPDKTVKKPMKHEPQENPPVFFSPRSNSPKDFKMILNEESQRYWSPNHAKLKSNDYFLAKRQIKLQKDQGVKEKDIEVEFLKEKSKEKIETTNALSLEIEEERKKLENKMANELLILTQMKMNEKNRTAVKTIPKSKEEDKNKKKLESTQKNHCEAPAVQAKKPSDHYFLMKKKEILPLNSAKPKPKENTEEKNPVEEIFKEKLKEISIKNILVIIIID